MPKTSAKRCAYYPTQVVKRYLETVGTKLGLIQQVGYNRRKRATNMKLLCWDDYEQLKDGVELLDRILEELRAKENGENGEKD